MTTASGAPTSGASNANFQKLRPVCVNLLRLINKAPDDNALEDALAQLHVCLEVVDTLTPSLIHYVFYPVSQLLNTHENGIFSFPNRVRTLIFRVLAQLATDWWQTWTWAHVQSCSKAETCPTTISGSPDWRVWEQLLFLGVMTLSGGPRSSPCKIITRPVKLRRSFWRGCFSRASRNYHLPMIIGNGMVYQAYHLLKNSTAQIKYTLPRSTSQRYETVEQALAPWHTHSNWPSI